MPHPLVVNPSIIEFSTLYQTITFWTGPNSKHLQMTKRNVGKILKTVYWKVENIMGKGENAIYQHFLFFPQCYAFKSSSNGGGGGGGGGEIMGIEDFSNSKALFLKTAI